MPVNVTLLFSRAQYVAAAEAYLRGIERRVAAGLNPDVGSVASLFVSRWDVAVADKAPEVSKPAWYSGGEAHLQNISELIATDRSLRLLNFGARDPAHTMGKYRTKDPKASDMLYVKSLAAPYTVTTRPEKTLQALADHGELGTMLPPDGGDAEKSRSVQKGGRRYCALAAQLQREGAESFDKSWDDLLASIAQKSTQLKS